MYQVYRPSAEQTITKAMMEKFITSHEEPLASRLGMVMPIET